MIEIVDSKSTGRTGIILDLPQGKYELFLTNQDFNELKKKIHKRPKKKPESVYQLIKSRRAVDLVWRGDTYGKTFKTRKRLVKLIMPDLAKVLGE